MTENLNEHVISEWLDDLPILVKSSDSRGNCIYVNKYWSTYTGKFILEEKGIEWQKNIHPDDREVYLKKINAATEAQLNYSCQVRIRDKRSNYYRFEDFGKPIFDNFGKYVGHSSIYTSVSEERSPSENLSNLLEAKEIQQRALIHQIKNNMAVVLGMIDLHSDAFENTKDQIAFRSFQQRIFAIAHINDFFYTTAPSPSIKIEKILEGIIKKSCETYTSENITVEIELDAIEFELEKAMPCGLILNELLSNALKHAFNPSDSGEVIISLSKKSEIYSLSVSDNGKGVENINQLTNPCTLGYTLINSLTQQLNGNIEINNKEGLSIRIQFKI